MAASSGGHDNSPAASSHPLTPDNPTTANTKRPRLATLPRPTLTSPSLPHSSNNNQLPKLRINLIAEILAWLPVKTLLRFKCVCKSWKSLISDPNFARKHLRISASDPTRLHLIVSFRSKIHRPLLRDYPLTPVFNSHNVSPSQRMFPNGEQYCFNFVHGSCNGMLCLADDPSLPIVWNPSTGKFKYLPEIPGGNACKLGFGYDHFTDTYKVVSVSIVFQIDRPKCDYDTDVLVHTLGTDSWRKIQKFPVGIPCESGRSVSGALNWLVLDKPWSRGVIVSLDLGSEAYRQLSPPVYGANAKNVSLTSSVLKGCLCILAHCSMYSDVWVMKEYGKFASWTKVCKIPYRGNRPEFHPYYSRAFCLSSDDDEVLLENTALETGRSLVVYNHRTDISRTPGIQVFNGGGGIQKFAGDVDAEVYAESLISPRSY